MPCSPARKRKGGGVKPQRGKRKTRPMRFIVRWKKEEGKAKFLGKGRRSGHAHYFGRKAAIPAPPREKKRGGERENVKREKKGVKPSKLSLFLINLGEKRGEKGTIISRKKGGGKGVH